MTKITKKFFEVIDRKVKDFLLTKLNLYNIIISKDKNYVWFRTAKVGTRTIESILRGKSRFHIYGSNLIFNRRKYKTYYKFVFVRNPWDRVVSCYCDKVLGVKDLPYYEDCYDKDFKYFVKFIEKKNLKCADRHIRLQSYLFPVDDVDYIGRFETFESDLKHVLNKLNIDSHEIPKKNTTMRRDYKKYYNEETKQIIAKKYEKDIKNFGYKFDD